jgi:general stress protein YciG
MPSNSSTTGKNTSQRGFASMDREKQRQIASKGGQSVPPEKRSFSQDRQLAAEAGRKGGEHSHGGRKPATDKTEEGRRDDRVDERKDDRGATGSSGGRAGGTTTRGAQHTRGH